MEIMQVTELDVKVSVNNLRRVKPSSPTPTHSLYLSNLDDMLASRFFTPTLYFYKGTDNNDTLAFTRTCKRLRRALARALVFYYPLAGRLRDIGGGKLEVICTGEGALFVEAVSRMALAEMGPLHCPNPCWKPLIYHPPEEQQAETDGQAFLAIPLVIAQATRFACGGFTLGLRICHCMCDGMGAMQFVGAWAELTRGRPRPSVVPEWNRERLRPRSPPSVAFAHVEFENIEDRSNLRELMREVIVQTSLELSAEFLRRLKESASTAAVRCTTFDALAGAVWRAWIGGLRIAPGQQQMRLSFAANARGLLASLGLGEGFYGNAIGIACATSTAQALVTGPLSEAARLVQAARKGICEEYIRSTVDFLELRRPQQLEFSAKLGITQWTRFSLYDTDFGWGRPLYAGPIDLSATPQLCLFLPHPSHADSVVLCICLPRSCVGAFAAFLLRDALPGAR